MRSGPSPSKYGSGTVTPSSPNQMAMGVGPYVRSAPIERAVACRCRSICPTWRVVSRPSMREAVR